MFPYWKKIKNYNRISLLPIFNYSCPVYFEPVVLNLGAATFQKHGQGCPNSLSKKGIEHFMI